MCSTVILQCSCEIKCDLGSYRSRKHEMPKPSYTNNDVIAEYLKVNVIDLLNECYMYILVNVH